MPDTLAEDGDPIDALVLLTEPTFPGCLVHARVIGVFWMHDTKGPDAKLLCVSADDPRFAHLQELGDVPMHQISEIWHFFQIYEALEPDKSAETRTWENRKEADPGAGGGPPPVRREAPLGGRRPGMRPCASGQSERPACTRKLP